MLGNLRWRDRRSMFRRPDEQIRRGEYEVVRLSDDRLTKPFVLQHHYSRAYCAARFRFGLFPRGGGELVGVAVFSHPVNDRTLTNVFGGAAVESVELGRFVLLDSVKGNGETYFLGRCLRELRREGLRGVVSFSDPMPRETATGERVFPGHIGTVYQAGSANFLGLGTPSVLHLLPDGRAFNKRAASKVRNGEEGRDYAARQLVEAGADDPAEMVGRLYATHADWLAHWVGRLTRRVRHPGNLKYAWFFQGSAAYSLPYPKVCRDSRFPVPGVRGGTARRPP
jgi:hypothetical protein